ncbi:MAG: hypothetical protein RL318_1700 [Fibrobacterota bacterium]
MAGIFRHVNYRAFLREWYEDAKRAGRPLSYRFLAGKVGLDPSFIAKILHGEKHLPEDQVEPMLLLLKLPELEAEYFRRLVRLGRARPGRDQQEAWEKLGQLRGIDLGEVGKRAGAYYSHWHYPAIRVLLLAWRFDGDCAALARRLDPPITEKEAHDALVHLEEQGFLVRDGEGVLVPSDVLLTAGKVGAPEILRGYQDRSLELARRSLQVHPLSRRDISTLTLSIGCKDIPTLQEMTREFRQKLLRWAGTLDSTDMVMQVCLAAYPAAWADPEEDAV